MLVEGLKGMVTEKHLERVTERCAKNVEIRVEQVEKRFDSRLQRAENYHAERIFLTTPLTHTHTHTSLIN